MSILGRIIMSIFGEMNISIKSGVNKLIKGEVKLRFLVLGMFLLFATNFTFAQHQELLEKPNLWRGKSKRYYDTSEISRAFQDGVLQGHFRYFYMNTDNQGAHADYFAHAAGGGIRYESAPYHGLQVAISGFFIFNMHSSDLGLVDSLSNQKNRYEIQLFDIENPYNHKDIDRLEELYVKYNFSKSNITAGRQLINTPFINLQDGRMRPTGVEGFWADLSEWKNTRIEGGYLYGITPRGTVQWFDIGESIGLYGVGVDQYGLRSKYAGKLESSWVSVLGIHHNINSNAKFNVWNTTIDNILTTNLIQAEFNIPRNKKQKTYFNAQMMRQFPIGDGGNSETNYKYIQPNEKAMAYSFRLGQTLGTWDMNLNYTRITSEGRYLMPREWGRDPFYTFLPRERNEGFGNVHAATLRITKKFIKYDSKINLSGGYFKLPSVYDYRLNKYGLPSYAQVNLDLRHDFGGIWKGMELQFLTVYKHELAAENLLPKHIFNKVNMLMYNVVFNYHF